MAIDDGDYLGTVREFHDWTGDTSVWMRVDREFQSKQYGPALSGLSYTSEDGARRADRRHYMGRRALPVDRLIDRAAEQTARADRARARRAVRTGGGRCEHCGQQTKGGRFLPGHDAQLKSVLQQEACGQDSMIRAEAVAESRLRADGKRSSPWFLLGLAEDVPLVETLMAEGDAFLRRRIEARWTRAK